MARGRNKGQDSTGGTDLLEAPVEELTDQAATVTEDEPDGESNSGSPAVTEGDGETPAATTEAKAELTDEQIAEAVSAFMQTAGEAVAERDTATGTLADADVDKVNVAYSQLDGAKIKAAAKKAINEAMKDAMNSMDIVLARAYMQLNDKLKATKAPKAKKEKAERVPLDPTDAFVERVATLVLAGQLAGDVVPEGVSEGWDEKVGELVDGIDRDQVRAYRDWLLSEAEDKGDAPDASQVVIAAVKLSLGKAAKPGKAPKRVSTGGGSTYDGPRRDIAKHILEAFANKEAGEFMLISEIRKYVSDEYGTDYPSAGAISARLFPKSGKCTIEGVEPATDEKGNKGATKV